MAGRIERHLVAELGLLRLDVRLRGEHGAAGVPERDEVLLREPPRDDGGEHRLEAVHADRGPHPPAAAVARDEHLERVSLRRRVRDPVGRRPRRDGEIVRRRARLRERPPRRSERRRAHPDPARLVEQDDPEEAGAVLEQVPDPQLELLGPDPVRVRAELRELLEVAGQAEPDVLLEPEDVPDHGAALLVELLPVEHPQQAEQGGDEQRDRRARRVPLPAMGGGGGRQARAVVRGGDHSSSGLKRVAR